MGIIIDICIILFILISVFLGYKKGLIALGINLFAFIISIVIALVLYRPIAGIIINSTQIDEKLQETIEVNIGTIVDDNDENAITGDIIESAKNGMLPQAAQSLSINIIYVAIIFILFILARICLIFITALANLIAKLPILNEFNKLGGIIYGLLRGFIIIYVILMCINLIIVLNPKSSINNIMEQTYLAKTMSTYNVLNLFFK